MIELNEMVKEFLVESHENLDQLDRDLITLEQDPSSQPTLASIFRTIHTIKGTCGFLGFGKLESLSHAGENLLCKLRDGDLRLNPDITSGLLAQVDAIREMLQCIERIGNEGEGDYTSLVTRLGVLQTGNSEPTEEEVETADDSRPVVNEIIAAMKTVERTRGAVEAPAVCEAEPVPAAVVEAPRTEPQKGNADAAKGPPESRLSEGSIRVDVGLLDKLMNRVGELVLARNQILQFTGLKEDAALLSACQRLNLITTELQEGVMKTRMQPIDTIWNKFPRVVRDLALQCGKQVRVEMEGKETELDKTIVEAIKDPLTHLVRNSVDHGIEPPSTRTAHGKQVEGRLLLRAFHEGGQVIIEITDDGAGLNVERIKIKALERGVVSAEQAARMSDRELAQLIFQPGFSTAEKITNVSGRGVGMDVVKTNIEKIGGAVDLQSELGRGTTIRIKIPLTLAIIPALVVGSGGERFAIPQVSLLELVRLEGDQARRGIERLHDAPVYRLRGRLLPLVYLNRELGLHAAQGTDGDDDDVVNIVVLRADERQFGLVVDSINDTEEIVVKPLGKQLKGVSIFAGATIMGDGAVALILDVLGLAQSAHVVSEVRDRNLADRGDDGHQTGTGGGTLLVVGAGSHRLALPISMVARLEEIDPSSIEMSSQRPVVQYRGEMLPIVSVADALGIRPAPDEGAPLQIVVYSRNGLSAGLVVDRIIDTVQAAGDVERRARAEGVIGSMVIQGRVTDVIDPEALIRKSDPAFFDAIASA